MHAEELVGRRDLIVRVLSAKDLSEAAQLLKGSEFGADAEAAISLYLSRKEIRLFDLYLDHAVLSKIGAEYAANGKAYASSRAIDVAGVEEAVGNDINSYNVLGILRARLWGLPDDDIRSLVVVPPPGTRLTLLQKLSTVESLPEAIKLVRDVFPDSSRPSGTDEEMIDSVENYFTMKSMQVASRASVWQGFGVASALALIRLLEFEVKNLAAIAIGIESHMETKIIASRLVLY
jgi:V/A-type H+-transporting ATPase subunit C